MALLLAHITTISFTIIAIYYHITLQYYNIYINCIYVICTFITKNNWYCFQSNHLYFFSVSIKNSELWSFANVFKMSNVVKQSERD